MLNDKMERRSYRKSPGRQYEYEYNPLHEQKRTETSNLGETWNSESNSRKPSHAGAVLSPRPDPRRTRQIMRQNILASKSHSTTVLEDEPLDHYDQDSNEPDMELTARPGGTQNYRSQRGAPTMRRYSPERYQEFEEEQIAADWIKHGESVPDYMDPDLGYEDYVEDPLNERVREAPVRTPARTTRRFTELDEEEERGDLLAKELKDKQRKSSRRKLLVGAVVVGGAAVAAYELLPRIPQALDTGAANIGHQLQQAFNNGVTSGAATARKEVIDGLNSIEGFSLDGAIEAAKLTRVSYDVFVSPLVTLAATVADDFLSVTLDALITGRRWLAQINEDSPTLAALQTVLQSWVDQANEMPEKLQAITDTDLDGAQNYLRSLQQTIKQQQAQLNAQGTPTATGSGTPQPSATQQP
jgi:hypothetical protein